MKIEAGRVAAFLSNPVQNIVLIYGPDAGLVAERGLACVKAVLGSVDDPFRFAELHGPDGSGLLSEATAASLSGGRRVVRVREASEALVKPVESLLGSLTGALVILEAGALTAKSKLRVLAEKHAGAAAIACYEIDAARLPRAVSDRLRTEGVGIEADAAAWVARNIAGEEGPLRQAVEILTLYAGAARNLTLTDVSAALADGGDTSIQDAIDATLTGDTTGTDRALALAYDEGVSPVGILRVLLSELMRLLVAAASIGPGVSAADAMGAMRPPVFFKRASVVTAALGLWSVAALKEAIRVALAAESACKHTHTPDQAYCRQMMLGLASRARNAARR